MVNGLGEWCQTSTSTYNSDSTYNPFQSQMYVCTVLKKYIEKIGIEKKTYWLLENSISRTLSYIAFTSKAIYVTKTNRPSLKAL